MSKEDYLGKAESLLNEIHRISPHTNATQRIIALALLDIAKTLREIKAMAKREVED